MRHNMGNKVYQVKGNDDLPNWLFELANKGITFRPQEDGITIDTTLYARFIPVGDCIVYSVNGLFYTCTKEHAEMEGWSF